MGRDIKNNSSALWVNVRKLQPYQTVRPRILRLEVGWFFLVECSHYVFVYLHFGGHLVNFKCLFIADA
ncbi:MAG: hypothetical protein QOG55_1379 [Acidobacteriaceae bacterium]|nr:hypothetical protein [Acidobacteriaceae bacterium]